MSATTSAEAAPTIDEKRPVGAFALLALGVNGIVGVGIFFIPAKVAQLAPGGASILVFALTGLALVPVALSFAALGRRFDEDGGPVVFARAAFGELASFLVGWLAYVSAILSASAVMVGLTRAVAPSLGLRDPLALNLAATVLVTALTLVVASGITISARAWTTLTVLKLLPLLALLAAFVAFGGIAAPVAPSSSFTGGSWARAALVVMFSYQGFEIVPVIAGQVRSSERAVPFATVGSLALSAALYMGLMWACVVSLPGLASSDTPLVETARVWGGAGLARLVGIGTSVSALGICLGMMVTTPRYLSALASGEKTLFDLDRMAPNGVPLRALFVTWVLVCAVVQRGDLLELFTLSSLAVLTQYVVTAAALAELARRRQRGLALRHVWLAFPALGLGVYLALQGATPREGLASLGAVVAGLGLSRLAKPRS